MMMEKFKSLLIPFCKYERNINYFYVLELYVTIMKELDLLLDLNLLEEYAQQKMHVHG